MERTWPNKAKVIKMTKQKRFGQVERPTGRQDTRQAKIRYK